VHQVEEVAHSLGEATVGVERVLHPARLSK